MKQTFSFCRVALLARKHYTENRTNYLIGVGGYLLFLLLGLYGVFRSELPSMNMLETIIIFVGFFVPIVIAKMSFVPYIWPNRQVEAFTLPATRGEKFFFGVFNTIVVSALAIAGIEVAASLAAPDVHPEVGDVLLGYSRIVGHWFAGLSEMLAVVPMFAATAIFACSMARKGNVAVPMFTTWGAIALLYALPTFLLHNGDGLSVASLDFPAFITTLNSHIEVGETVLEYTTNKLVQPHWLIGLIVPAVLLVAAWFKFHEKDAK